MKRKVRMYKPGGSSFEPHMMYNPNEDFKGYEARVPEDHERMAEMGFVHEDEMQQMLEQQRKQFGGKVRRALKKEFRAGGSNAMQGTDINDFSKNRTGVFKNFMSNSAQAQIAEEEAMNFYDQQMQAQQMAMQPQFNFGGFNMNRQAFYSPDDYLTKNRNVVNKINMFGTQANKTKQGVTDAFSRIGNMAYDVINNYDPFGVTTDIKTKIEKPYRKEYRQAKRDYKKDIRDWRNDLDAGAAAGAPMPEFNFTPGGMDLTAQYGMQVPYIEDADYEELPTYNLAGRTTDPPPWMQAYSWPGMHTWNPDGNGYIGKVPYRNPTNFGNYNTQFADNYMYLPSGRNVQNWVSDVYQPIGGSQDQSNVVFDPNDIERRQQNVDPNKKNYWDYTGDDANKQREDDAAQYWFEGFDSTPDSYMYDDDETGIKSRDDYEAYFSGGRDANGNVDYSKFDRAAADAYEKRKSKEYYDLSHEEKLKYDPEAVRRLPNGDPVRDEKGYVVKGKAGLDYNDKGEYKKGSGKSKSNTKTNTTNNNKNTADGTAGGDAGGNAADAAEKQIKGGDDKTLVQDEDAPADGGGSGNVKYDEEFDVKETEGNTTTNTNTTTTTDNQGNVFVPRQSWQLGAGRYRDGMYRGFGQAPPMIAYNPQNTYLDYYKHRGKGLLRPDKTVMKFSHYAPGAMPQPTPADPNVNTQQQGDGQTVNQNQVNNQTTGRPSVDDIIARETQGMSKGDARKTARNIKRANRQGMLEDFMTDEERGITPESGVNVDPSELDASGGAGTENAPNPEEVKKAQQAKTELLEGYEAFKEKNPNATEEEKRAYFEQSQQALTQKLKAEGFRPSENFEGQLYDFLREGDPNEIFSGDAQMMRYDEETGDAYFNYPGTNYIYKADDLTDEEGNVIGGKYSAVNDPAILSKYNQMKHLRGNEDSYYKWDDAADVMVPRGEGIPAQYDAEGNQIMEWTDKEFYEADPNQVGYTVQGLPEYDKIKYENYPKTEAGQDQYRADVQALQEKYPYLTDEEEQNYNLRDQNFVAQPYMSKEEKEQQELEKRKQSNPRQFISPSQGMADLTNPDKTDIGAFTKETRKGDRKFDYRDMRKEGFSRKDVRNMKRTVKDYDANVEMTGNPEFAMNEIERAYDAANANRYEDEKERLAKLQRKGYGGQYYYGGTPMYPGGGSYMPPMRAMYPMYVHGGEGGHPEDAVVGMGDGMIPVEGLDMSQSVFAPIMEGMNQNMPEMPYDQPIQYETSENMGGEGTPLNMPTIEGPTPEQKKWAETTMKRKSDKFGLRNRNWTKFLPAAGQVAAAIGNAINEPDNMAKVRRSTDAMSIYSPDRTWRAGADAGMNAFNPVGVTPARSAPVQYTGGAYGQYGGQFKEGGTYMLSDADIERMKAMGATIEYLD